MTYRISATALVWRLITAIAAAIVGAAASAGENVTIFVDGITPWKAWSTLLPPQYFDLFVGASELRSANYLRDSPLARAIAKDLGGVQEYVLWSGSPSDTINLDRAVSETLTKILVADRAGKEVHLVTQSMGTVIGYLALARYKDLMSRTSSADRYRGVANFVTLASPLGSSVLMHFLIEANRDLGIDKAVADHQTADSLMIRGSWLNVHAQNDPIGTDLGLPWVSNEYRPFGGNPIATHSFPYEDSGSVCIILQFLRQSPSFAKDTDPREAVGGIPGDADIISVSSPPAHLIIRDKCLTYKCEGPNYIKRGKQVVAYEDWLDRKGKILLSDSVRIEYVDAIDITVSPGMSVAQQATHIEGVGPVKKGDKIFHYANWGEGCETIWVNGVVYGYRNNNILEAPITWKYKSDINCRETARFYPGDAIKFINERKFEKWLYVDAIINGRHKKVYINESEAVKQDALSWE